MKGPPIHSESASLQRLASMTDRERDALARAVAAAARPKLFFYKGRGVHPLGMAPMVAVKRLYPSLRAVVETLFEFQQAAPDLYRADYRGFSRLIRLENHTRAWFERLAGSTPRPWPLLMRPDFSLGLRDGRHELALFELNSLMLGGIHIQSAALRIMDEVVLPRLGRDAGSLGIEPTVDLMEYFKAWITACRRQRRAVEGGLALLESLPVGGGFSELPRMKRDLREAGWRVEHGDPRELVQGPDGVTLRGMPVGYAYRDFSFEDAPCPASPDMAAFARLWREGRVAPGFGADFDQKGILECLSSEEFAGLFTTRQARLLRRHVPWTRVLSERRVSSPEGRRVDLPAFVARRQEDLVLKPSWSSGGEGILIGRRAGRRAWSRALSRGLSKPGSYAVQAYVDNPPVPCCFLRDGALAFKECRYTLGAFHDGCRLGFHVRVSPRHIVNVARGGALAPVYFAA